MDVELFSGKLTALTLAGDGLDGFCKHLAFRCG